MEKILFTPENAAITAQTAVNALRNGQLVVLPTETVYGIAALAPKAVERLLALKQRADGHPMALAVSGKSVIDKFFPNLCELADRFSRRCFPGSVTLVFDVAEQHGNISSLPMLMQKTVAPEGKVAFRVPQHPFVLSVLSLLNEPILLTSANLAGKTPATNADDAAKELGNAVDLIVDCGSVSSKSRDETPASTVVLVEKTNYRILRQGAVSKHSLDRLAAKLILFVCTGNTCRSPMAETICASLIAKRLGVPVDELEEHGYIVVSAGLMAHPNSPASRKAIEIMDSLGLSLEEHLSQLLSEKLLRFADRIYTMTREHRKQILSAFPEAAARLSVLRLDGGDISDPIGGSFNDYGECAKQIEEAIRLRFDEL